mmetsp:Transcript_10477/g.23793  ORF Transcript_10477/g.23793 Transcript_10477/m.23793 type:complete len:520 (-) Transcript_10477:86-1645(-)
MYTPSPSPSPAARRLQGSPLHVGRPANHPVIGGAQLQHRSCTAFSRSPQRHQQAVHQFVSALPRERVPKRQPPASMAQVAPSASPLAAKEEPRQNALEIGPAWVSSLRSCSPLPARSAATPTPPPCRPNPLAGFDSGHERSPGLAATAQRTAVSPGPKVSHRQDVFRAGRSAVQHDPRLARAVSAMELPSRRRVQTLQSTGAPPPVVQTCGSGVHAIPSQEGVASGAKHAMCIRGAEELRLYCQEEAVRTAAEREGGDLALSSSRVPTSCFGDYVYALSEAGKALEAWRASGSSADSAACDGARRAKLCAARRRMHLEKCISETARLEVRVLAHAAFHAWRWRLLKRPTSGSKRRPSSRSSQRSGSRHASPDKAVVVTKAVSWLLARVPLDDHSVPEIFLKWKEVTLQKKITRQQAKIAQLNAELDWVWMATDPADITVVPSGSADSHPTARGRHVQFAEGCEVVPLSSSEVAAEVKSCRDTDKSAEDGETPLQLAKLGLEELRLRQMLTWNLAPCASP